MNGQSARNSVDTQSLQLYSKRQGIHELAMRKSIQYHALTIPLAVSRHKGLGLQYQESADAQKSPAASNQPIAASIVEPCFAASISLDGCSSKSINLFATLVSSNQSIAFSKVPQNCAALVTPLLLTPIPTTCSVGWLAAQCLHAGHL